MASTPRSEVISERAPAQPQPWAPVVIRKAQIDAAIEALSRAPSNAGGRRTTSFVHPMSSAPGLGLTPGTEVSVNVLLPGESRAAVHQNSSILNVCIGGIGTAMVGDRKFSLEKNGIWNIPSMTPYSYRNDGESVFAFLSYSNAPLLEKLRVHLIEENPPVRTPKTVPTTDGQASSRRRARDLAENFAIGSDGARLLGYEWLVDIDTVDNHALHWPWKEVVEHVNKVAWLGDSYTGRALLTLYNPATERFVGVNPSYFATIGLLTPTTGTKPHRHTSTAINYAMEGESGYAIVDGERIDWTVGDMWVAPGWRVHENLTDSKLNYVLTVQDEPLQLRSESLVWQEHLSEPVRSLGNESGFETNRVALTDAG